MMSTVSVSQLAKSQTLVFDGFTSATSNVGSGVINFQRGSWSNGVFTSDTKYNSVDVNIGDTAYSITDNEDAINAANLGATASVVKKGTTDFALVIRAASGSSNAFRISVTEGNNAGLKRIEHSLVSSNTSGISSSAGATITTSSSHGYQVGDTVKYIAAGTALNGLTSLNSYKVSSVPRSTTFTLTNEDGSSITYGGGNGNSHDQFIRTNTETVAGVDASFQIDGVTVTRSNNIIDDVIDGASLTLSSTTTSDAYVSISTSKDKVLNALNNLIEEVNTISSQITELTARGSSMEKKRCSSWRLYYEIYI